MLTPKSEVVVLLSVCLSACLAGREDRLAYKDDLEKMLRDLEDSDGKQSQARPLEHSDKSVLDTTPQASKQQNPPLTSPSPSDGKPEQKNDEDLVDQISKVIENYRKKNQRKNFPPGDSQIRDVTPPGILPTTETNESTTAALQNKEDINQVPSKPADTKDEEPLMKGLLEFLKKYSERRSPDSSVSPTTLETTTLSPVSTKDPDLKGGMERLKQEALDVAARAARLYLHLTEER